MELDCYVKYLLKNAQDSPDGIAILEKDYGIWNTYTWQQCFQNVKYYSLGLLSLGLGGGDRVILISDERPEAFWTLAAIQSCNAIPVPLWPDLRPEEILFFINHSQARFVVCEDQEQVDKLLEIKEQIPHVMRVLYWDSRGMRHYNQSFLIDYQLLMELGQNYENDNPGSFEENVSRISGDSVAQINYTSGTTGTPKGCISHHDDLLFTAGSWWEKANLEVGDRCSSILPPSHVFEQWVAWAHYVKKLIMCFCEEPETVMSDLREIGPKVLVLSPSQWLNLYSSSLTKIEDSPWINRFAFHALMAVRHKLIRFRFTTAEIKPNLLWRIINRATDLLIFRQLRDNLGLLKTEMAFTGGALMDANVSRFYHAIGVPLGQVYGLTETGIISCHTRDDIDPATIGPPVPGRTVQIAPDGEIFVSRYGGFRGYYMQPELDEKVFAGEFIRTGDAGFFNEHGHLVYLDRLNNLRRLRTGANFAPLMVEGRLKSSPYIQEAVAVGDETKDFLSVMIVLNFIAVSTWAERNHLGFTTLVDLSQRDEVAELIRREVCIANRSLPGEAQIKKFVIFHKELDADEAELTRSRKTRPEIIKQRYVDIVEAVYIGKSEVPVTAKVQYRDGRTGTVSANVKVRAVDE